MPNDKSKLAKDLRQAVRTSKNKTRAELEQELVLLADEFDPPDPDPVTELAGWEYLEGVRGPIAISPSGAVYLGWSATNADGIVVDGVKHKWV